MFYKNILHISYRQFRITRPNYSHHPVKSFLKFSIIASFPIVPAVYYYSVLNNHERRLINVTVGGIGRFLRAAEIGLLISIDYWWSLRYEDYDSNGYLERLKIIHLRSAKRLLNGCLSNGGLYIKLGQGLANLDHVLPKEYTQTLKILQDKCLERKKNELFLLFQEEFGKSHTDMFESFCEDPIAAASLAQVFKAERKDGAEVAVKVQYIDLRDRFHGDVATVRFLLSLAGKIFPKYDFTWVIDELKGPLESELDFLNEARNSEKCRQDLSHLEYAYVPKVFWDQSSERILTTEFINGIKISDTDRLVKENFSLADIDTKLITIFAEQIFHSGFVHADPHPGNLLVRKHRNDITQIVILDHGLYQILPKNYKQTLCNLWKAVVMNNHTEMKKYSDQLGVGENDYRLFCIALVQKYVPSPTNDEDVMKWFFGLKGASFRSLTEKKRNELKIEAAKIHDQLLDIFKRIPGSLILVTRNLNAVRSIIRLHGNVVDRQSLMAHCATRYLFQGKGFNVFPEFYQRLLFELSLWYDSFKRFIWKYLNKWFQLRLPVDFVV